MFTIALRAIGVSYSPSMVPFRASANPYAILDLKMAMNKRLIRQNPVFSIT
jgi:hypothetical protein